MSAKRGVDDTLSDSMKRQKGEIYDANITILTCKGVWNNCMDSFSATDNSILLEVVELACKRDGILVQPTRAAMLSGLLDAVKVAQMFVIFMKLLQLESKSDELRSRIKIALGEIAETGADWNGDVPNLQDLIKQTPRQCRTIAKKWREGETFIRGWEPIFEGFKAEWNETKVIIEKGMDDCFKDARVVVADEISMGNPMIFLPL